MSWLSELLQGVPLNAVLRERVAIAEQKFKDMEAENKSLRVQVTALTTENETLKADRAARQAAEDAAKSPPQVKWGCYVFAGDEKLYCPACYDTKGKRHLTTRLNVHRRMCSVCKAVLGAG